MKLTRSLLLIVATVVCQNTTIQGMARTIDRSAEGYHYEDHALKRMDQRKVDPKMVSYVIENGKWYPHWKKNRTLCIDLDTKLAVIIVPEDKAIVTVMPNVGQTWLDSWFKQRETALLHAKIKGQRTASKKPKTSKKSKIDGNIRAENWSEIKAKIKANKKQNPASSASDYLADFYDEDFDI